MTHDDLYTLQVAAIAALILAAMQAGMIRPDQQDHPPTGEARSNGA